MCLFYPKKIKKNWCRLTSQLERNKRKFFFVIGRVTKLFIHALEDEDARQN